MVSHSSRARAEGWVTRQGRSSWALTVGSACGLLWAGEQTLGDARIEDLWGCTAFCPPPPHLPGWQRICSKVRIQAVLLSQLPNNFYFFLFFILPIRQFSRFSYKTLPFGSLLSRVYRCVGRGQCIFKRFQSKTAEYLSVQQGLYEGSCGHWNYEDPKAGLCQFCALKSGSQSVTQSDSASLRYIHQL